MRRLTTFALALMLPGCLSCTPGSARTETPPAVSPQAEATVSPVDPPAPSSDPSFYQSSGPIVVENQIDIAAQREGLVSEIARDTGSPVRKGDLLAKLDDRQLLADREAAQQKLESIAADVSNWESELKVLQADLQRAQKMWEAHIISREVYEHTQYNATADQFELARERKNYLSQQATVQSLDFELQKTKITAPFDGVVARRYVRAGQRVGLGDRLFWVTAVAPLRVRFTLPERFIAKTQSGDTVTISSFLPGSSTHTARIIQVSPVVDPVSDTIEVVAEIMGPSLDLRPGMKANVRVRDAR